MNSPLYGLILAGGTSSRMGRDKAALHFHERPQTQHLASLLTPYVEQLFVSIRESQLHAPHLAGLATITDHYHSPSPLNGIVSAMRFKPSAAWLVVAVDMPNVTAGSFEKLIAMRDGNAIATCFASPVKGGPDPLLAIWESHGFEKLQSLLGDTPEHVCPRQALKKFGARILSDAVPDRDLANINTPEEFACLKKAL